MFLDHFRPPKWPPKSGKRHGRYYRFVLGGRGFPKKYSKSKVFRSVFNYLKVEDFYIEGGGPPRSLPNSKIFGSVFNT